MADRSGCGMLLFSLTLTTAVVAGIVYGDAVDSAWRKWAIGRGVAEYDPQTGKWREKPCKCEVVK